MRKQFLVLAVCVVLAGCKSGTDPNANNQKFDLGLSSNSRVYLCHGFECFFRDRVEFSDNDILALREIMSDAKTAEEERAAVQKAIQWFERKAGEEVGTKDDLGGLNFFSGTKGQQDCIDESTTTTNFLVMLSKNGLLNHHTVGSVHARGFFLDGRYPHATATLTESFTQKDWAIDTWVRDNGEPAVIMPLNDWMAARPGQIS